MASSYNPLRMKMAIMAITGLIVVPITQRPVFGVINMRSEKQTIRSDALTNITFMPNKFTWWYLTLE
jgi:hypothetical protein